MRILTIAGAVGLAAFASLHAKADLLTFPNTSCSLNTDGSGALAACSDYGYINQAYGDTAKVNVTYVDKINPGRALRWWDTDYNTLQGVAWGGNSDATGGSWSRIEIQGLGNSSVTLNSFQLGAYPNTGRGTNLVILDLNDNVLFNYGNQTIGTNNVPNTFSPAVTSGGIAIEWKDSAYNVGIDNIDFSVDDAGTALPEPGYLGALGICASLMLFALYRQRRRVN